MLVLLASVAPLTFENNSDDTRKLLFAAGPQDEVPERMTYNFYNPYNPYNPSSTTNQCVCRSDSTCSASSGHPRAWCYITGATSFSPFTWPHEANSGSARVCSDRVAGRRSGACSACTEYWSELACLPSRQTGSDLYVYDVTAGKCGSAGLGVTTRDQCEAAATAANLSFFGDTPATQNFPRGCFKCTICTGVFHDKVRFCAIPRTSAQFCAIIAGRVARATLRRRCSGRTRRRAASTRTAARTRPASASSAWGSGWSTAPAGGITISNSGWVASTTRITTRRV